MRRRSRSRSHRARDTGGGRGPRDGHRDSRGHRDGYRDWGPAGGAGAMPPNMWNSPALGFGACGAFGAPPFGNPYGGPAMGFNQGGATDKRRKKPQKRKPGESSSSSSSSSSSESDGEDWRTKVWERGFQGMWPQQHMWGGQWPPGGCGQPPGPPAPPPPPPDDRPYGSQQHDQRGSLPPDLVKEDRSEPPEDMPIFLEKAVEDFVAVPKALIRKIIGKQAQTIIEIREKSGCFKVDARDQTSDPVQVKVHGTAESVEKARQIIMELIESTKTIHDGLEYVEIPRAKIGMVIGLKGSQVNEIQMQTNTKIDVNFETDPCKCYIKGPEDCVARAKQVLLTIAMQIEDEGSEYIEFPKSASGALLGPQGTRIRDLQEQSGATINVDKTGNTCRVRLTGTREQVSDAKALIMIEIEKNKHMVPAGRPQLSDPALRATGPPGAMVVPPHQPTSFPATLAESIARAKAAAQAVKDGLVALPAPGTDQDNYDSFAGTQEPPESGYDGSAQYAPW